MGRIRETLAGVILLFASPHVAAQIPGSATSDEVDSEFVYLCHSGDASPEEIAATEAAAIALGYRHRSQRARPVDRIGRTAAQPGGVEFGYGYTITWSYLRDGFVIPESPGVAPGTAPSSLFETMNQLHPGGFGEWHAKFTAAFAEWEAVTGNRYVYETEDDGAPLSAAGLGGRRGDVRIGMREIPGSVIAYNRLPSSGSDMVLGRGWGWNDPVFFQNAVLHEHGHGLGLDHVCPDTNTKLMEPTNNQITRPTFDDILGAQSLYGDALNHATDVARNFRRSRQLVLGVDVGRTDDYLIERPGTFVVGVRPLGAQYLEGPQIDDVCGTATIIDTQSYGDLTLQVLDAAGSVLVDRNARPAGAQERWKVHVNPAHLPARVRVGNASGNYQMYQLITGKLTSSVATPPMRDLFKDGFEQ